jgi:hypothetical protein
MIGCLVWLTGCQSEVDPHTHTPSEGIYSGDRVWELKPQSPIGTAFNYYYTISEQVKGTEEKSGEFSFQIKMESWLDWTWVNDSLMKNPAKMVFRRVRFQTVVGDSGRVQTIDTQAPMGENAMDWAFRNMLDKPFWVEFDENGIARQARGLDGVMADIYPDTLYGPNAHFVETLNLDALLPGRPVRAGETWLTVFGRRAQYPLFQDAVYELRSVVEDRASITSTAELRPHPNALKVIENGIPVSYELSGNKVGEYEWDLEGGFMRQSRTVYQMEGSRQRMVNDSTLREGTVTITRIESTHKIPIHQYDSTRFPKPIPPDTMVTDTVAQDSLAEQPIKPKKKVEIYPQSGFFKRDSLLTPRPPLKVKY